ncbi:MAG: hypothetical protein EXS17_06645 [Phycisphaerales bacterium]|nr:hypothetical protein [Phycisphaerales bacterium]
MPIITTHRCEAAEAELRTLMAHPKNFGRCQPTICRWTAVSFFAVALTTLLVHSGAFGQSEPTVPPGGIAPVGTAVAAKSQSPTTGAVQESTVPPKESKSTEPSIAADSTIEISPSGTITLAAQNVEIDSLLELLAVRSKQNIVASDKVEGKVSVNLYDVPFDQALEAILSVNGLISVREAGFIYVYTKVEFAESEKAARKIATRVYTLQFLSSLDAETLVKPILSKEGVIAARGLVTPGFESTIANGGADEYAFTARILVSDYEANLDEVARVLKEIDVAPQQVRVECTIVSASVNENNAYGVDFAAIGNLNFDNVTDSVLGNLVPPLGIPDAIRTGTAKPYPSTSAQAGAVSNIVSLPGAPPANVKMGLIAGDMAVFLNILDDVTDTTVLARPAVTCLNRQRASVEVGERVAYVTSTVSQTSTTQTVNFLDTGIILHFRPFISDDGMIRMELMPSISDYKLRQIGLPTSPTYTEVPDENKQEIRTNVRVRSGQTVVLGGLFSDKIVTQRKQVPGLSEVPFLGGLTGGQGDQVQRKEIIFLVTPTVIEDEKLYEEGRDSLEITENVRVGARAGLLPFSREQVTANYQQDAFDAYQDGDLTKTLFYSNAALRMKPVSPAMQQLRERVLSMPGSDYQDQIDKTLLERRTFSPAQTLTPVAPPTPATSPK